MKTHIRHVGNGLLVLFEGDKKIREIGTTPGWNFKDRDEIIVRYNQTIALADEREAGYAARENGDVVNKRVADKLVELAKNNEKESLLSFSNEEKGLLILLNKVYDGESLYDATRDFAEAFDEEFTPELKAIPKNEYNIQKGKFQVLVKWIPDEE